MLWVVSVIVTLVIYKLFTWVCSDQSSLDDCLQSSYFLLLQHSPNAKGARQSVFVSARNLASVLDGPSYKTETVL